MLVAVIADTHMPRGARRLPGRCVEQIERSDALIHAGDFVTAGVMHGLEEIGTPLHAVYGNVDEPALRRLLPETAVVDLGGHPVALIHDAGPRKGRLERLRLRFPDAEAAIFGHSHMPEHEESGGFQIFNPGSPTERRRAPSRSMGLLRAERQGLRFELVELP